MDFETKELIRQIASNTQKIAEMMEARKEEKMNLINNSDPKVIRAFFETQEGQKLIKNFVG